MATYGSQDERLVDDAPAKRPWSRALQVFAVLAAFCAGALASDAVSRATTPATEFMVAPESGARRPMPRVLPTPDRRGGSVDIPTTITTSAGSNTAGND